MDQNVLGFVCAIFLASALGLLLAGEAGADSADVTTKADGRSSAAGGGHDTAPAKGAGPETLPGRILGDRILGHGGPVKALAVSPDGRILASGSFDYSAMLWRLDTGQAARELARFDEVNGAINAVAFVPRPKRRTPATFGSGRKRWVDDGLPWVATAGDDGIVRLLETRSGEIVRTISGHRDKISMIDISPDGRFLVSASWDRTARVVPLGPTAADTSLGGASADRAADSVESVRAGDQLTPAVVLAGHRGPVHAAIFSHDGQSVITASSDGVLRLFNASTGALQRPLMKHGWGVNVLARLPQGRIVYGGTDGAVGVLTLDGTSPLKALARHGRPVLALAYRQGRLATAGAGGVINIWDSRTLSPIETFRNPFGPIWALAFSADAKTVYYGGLGDAIHIWRVTPRRPFEAVSSDFPRRFQVRGKAETAVERGRVQFARKCSVCHTLGPDGKNRAGPTLYRLFGRRIASVPGYRYSHGLRALDITWTPQTVSRLFEIGPDAFTPGSKMPLQKMTDPDQRADLIAFLQNATAGTTNDGTDVSSKLPAAQARAGKPAPGDQSVPPPAFEP